MMSAEEKRKMDNLKAVIEGMQKKIKKLESDVLRFQYAMDEIERKSSWMIETPQINDEFARNLFIIGRLARWSVAWSKNSDES